ncbi:MAG: hypothetical protein WCA29_03640 [Jiangellales bacterium]
MPRGSEYKGPPEALAAYLAVIEGSSDDCEVKGAKNPYTASNGNMFSFLTADGTMALRMSDELAVEFSASYDTGPVVQYGSVMRGYLSVPQALLDDTDALVPWFDGASAWIGTLPAKSTKK